MIKSASYSRLLDFESCPLKAKLKHVDRIPDPNPSPAADRGTAIHLEAENFVQGKGPLTANLSKFEYDLKTLKDLYKAKQVSLEGEWGFDKEWQVTDYRSAWFRLKADATAVISPQHIAVIDYKTGKKFGNEIKHGEQLQLYSLAVFLRNPHVQEVTAELWYLDLNELTHLQITRKQALTKYLKYFDRRARMMTECTRFEPRPSQSACRYCPYKTTGHCKVGV